MPADEVLDVAKDDVSGDVPVDVADVSDDGRCFYSHVHYLYFLEFGTSLVGLAI